MSYDATPEGLASLAADAVAEAEQARIEAARLRSLAEDSHPFAAEMFREMADFEEWVAEDWEPIAADPAAAIANAPKLRWWHRIRLARLERAHHRGHRRFRLPDERQPG